MRRSTTFSAGSDVPAATLNAMQDEQQGLVAATSNPAGALALKGADGRYLCTPDAGVADGHVITLDDSIDWRTRALWGTAARLESAAQRLHASSAWQRNDVSRALSLRSFSGTTGTGGRGAASATIVNGTPPVVASGSFAVVVDELATIAQRVWLYADPDDGALCLYNATGATLHAELFVWASGVAPTPGDPPPDVIPTLTDVMWIAPGLAADRPADPGGPALYRSTDTGAVEIWDGGAWRSMGGGGATLPVTDPAALLSSATPLRIVGTNGAGDGVLLTGAETRALISTAVSFEPADAGDWTAYQPAGGGTAAVTSGDLVLTQSPGATTLGDPGRCSLLRTLDPDIAEGEGFEIILRLAVVALEGSTLAHVHLGALADGSGGRELRARITHTGGVGLGLLDQGGAWRDAGAAGTVALDGTGWLRLRVRDRDAELSTGAGATQPTSWTRRVRLAWDLEITSGGYGTTAPPADWTRWGVALTQYSAPPSATVSLAVDHVSIRRFGA